MYSDRLAKSVEADVEKSQEKKKEERRVYNTRRHLKKRNPKRLELSSPLRKEIQKSNEPFKQLVPRKKDKELTESQNESVR